MAHTDVTHPIRAWRAALPRRGLPDARTAHPGVFVVDCGPSAQSAAELLDHLPEGVWHEQHAFIVMDTHGKIRDRCEVTAWSIEDELGASIFAVVDGALRKLSVTAVYADPVRVRRVEETIVDGLEPVSGDDEKTLSFLSDAITRSRQALAQEQQHLDKAAEDRLDAIPGARDDYGAGDDFRRAQEVLCAKVRDGYAIDTALLRALIRFGALHRSIRVGGAAVSAVPAPVAFALDAFVSACRLAAFDRTLEKQDRDATPGVRGEGLDALPAATQSELRDLENALSAIEHDLLENAEHQEWSDARNNAIQMRAAARHVEQARAALGAGYFS